MCRGGSRLEILKLDAGTQKLETVFGSDAFGSVRCMVPFRLTGQGKGESLNKTDDIPCKPSADQISWPVEKDYIILSSDSGRLSILEFLLTPSPHFASLYHETYGKSGSRRMVPGQWLGVDPRGRSVMVGA